MFGDHGLSSLLKEGTHGKSPKCLGGNLGDFGEFCKGLGLLNNQTLQTSQFIGHLLLDGFTLADKFAFVAVNQYFRRTVARVVVARHA